MGLLGEGWDTELAKQLFCLPSVSYHILEVLPAWHQLWGLAVAWTIFSQELHSKHPTVVYSSLREHRTRTVSSHF